MSKRYPFSVLEDSAPVDDCNAEVVGVGHEVTEFVIRDHVAPIFDLANVHGTGYGMTTGGSEV